MPNSLELNMRIPREFRKSHNNHFELLEFEGPRPSSAQPSVQAPARVETASKKSQAKKPWSKQDVDPAILADQQRLFSRAAAELYKDKQPANQDLQGPK